MGEYSEFHFDAKLRKNVPEDVVTILRYMLESEEGTPRPSLTHHPDIDPYYSPLFSTDLWQRRLRSDKSFAADTHSSLRYDDTAGSYVVRIRCNLDNGDALIEHFVSWILPSVNEPIDTLLGFHRLHQSKWPTPIYVPWTSYLNLRGEEARKRTPRLSDLPHDIDKIDQAALAVLYLSRYEGAATWKGFDWDVMGRLYQRGYITNPVTKAKSIGLTDAGMREAVRLFRALFKP
jgi:hypothetical protein